MPTQKETSRTVPKLNQMLNEKAKALSVEPYHGSSDCQRHLTYEEAEKTAKEYARWLQKQDCDKLLWLLHPNKGERYITDKRHDEIVEAINTYYALVLTGDVIASKFDKDKRETIKELDFQITDGKSENYYHHVIENFANRYGLTISQAETFLIEKEEAKQDQSNSDRAGCY